MKEYQTKKDQRYMLPHNVYMQMIYIIRSYDDSKQALIDMIDAAPDRDEGPSGSNISDPTLAYVIKTEEVRRQVDAVDSAISKVPVEYRRGVMANIITHEPYPSNADRATYSRWKQRMIYWTAEALHLA